MTAIIRTTQVMAQWLRWIARGISTLAAAFWLLILLDILACDALVGFICLNWDLALLAGLATASVLSVLIAWRRENVGGFAMILWGFAFGAIAYVTSRPRQSISMLVSGAPFLIAGSLFAARPKDGGHQVSLLVRGQRLADLREHGIVLVDSQTAEETV